MSASIVDIGYGRCCHITWFQPISYPAVPRGGGGLGQGQYSGSPLACKEWLCEGCGVRVSHESSGGILQGLLLGEGISSPLVVQPSAFMGPLAATQLGAVPPRHGASSLASLNDLSTCNPSTCSALPLPFPLPPYNPNSVSPWLASCPHSLLLWLAHPHLSQSQSAMCHPMWRLRPHGTEQAEPAC